MAEGREANLNLDTQRKEIATLLKTALREGDKWYLVDIHWFKQWKKYVGFDSGDTCNIGEVYPGPVDNSSILQDGDAFNIKEHLIDELDYILMPTDGWSKLVCWYGLTEGQEPIARKVVEQGMFMKHCKVEVYLTKLNLREDGNMDNIVTRRFSKADTIDNIEREMRKLFRIPDDRETKLWSQYMSNTIEPLNKPDCTVQNAGLFEGQVLVIKQMNKNKMCPPSPSTFNKMAETSILVAKEQFCCPVCLDLLKNPVTIPCGHNYCMSCITSCWDQKRVFSCPQCRCTFTQRLALSKNTIVAEMVDKLKTKLLTAVPAHSYAGAGEVECDICTGRKYKASKSCLTCLESYCQAHFEHHEEFHSGKPHNVIDATGRLQEMFCPKHDKQLDLYCCTDQQCICYLCMVDEHKNHAIVSAASQRTEKQKQLKETQKTFKLRIQNRDKEVQGLKEALKSYKDSAQKAVEDSEKIFTDLIRSIERSRCEVTQLIRDQEKAAVCQTEGLLKQLEQEIADLRRRDTELEQLSHTDDNIHFLQTLHSVDVTEYTDVPSIAVNSRLSFEDVGKSVSLLRDKLVYFCKEIQKISDTVTCCQNIPNHEPMT
ncbi:E3 ubiquitin-protein ligase TRIM47-like isoform X2 [Xyrauchen texanus]|uniref:E3 ubiquitin-protein ligase TRIM47-like isoform X2 n=1 Tax=Xyrauchen texanus TaxID=154827 RepID=UPI0022422776|nr:E3 ubiquitin-protein ligase TRIM47-like isoform X2 [Xyrauchen texanus]XP_051990793.1 E3 ubiquitin-protein ligase TRIM47-like isoform X2 [Xyrauchen texanus]